MSKIPYFFRVSLKLGGRPLWRAENESLWAEFVALWHHRPVGVMRNVSFRGVALSFVGLCSPAAASPKLRHALKLCRLTAVLWPGVRCDKESAVRWVWNVKSSLKASHYKYKQKFCFPSSQCISLANMYEYSISWKFRTLIFVVSSSRLSTYKKTKLLFNLLKIMRLQII